jgi:hypothetical protein
MIPALHVLLVLSLTTTLTLLEARLFDTTTAWRELRKQHDLNHTKKAAAILHQLQEANPSFINQTVESLLTQGMGPGSHHKYSSLGCDFIASIWNSSSTTYLKLPKLSDGIGNFVVQLVKAASFAYTKGWNFAGVEGELVTSFGGISEVDMLDFYFGDHSKLLVDESLINSTKRVNINGPIRSQSHIVKMKRLPNTTVHLHADRFELERYIAKHNNGSDEAIMHDFNIHMSPDFLSHLRRGAACGILKALSTVKREAIDIEPPSTIRVVAHIRMGDVALNSKFNYKVISQELYPVIFEAIRSVCPQCKFYAFTSVQHAHQRRASQYFFHTLEKLNVTVFADTEYGINATDEALNTIAHFSTADVLITAKSEFSVVSAYMNPNCVIYTQYQANFPLNDWIYLPYVAPNNVTHPHNIKVMVDHIVRGLPGCLAKKLPHKMKT